MSLSDYNGEEIIANLIFRKGKKIEERVWIPRSVFNDPQGKDAYIIGNGKSRIGFDLNILPKDTYGCNAVYRDYAPNYLVCVDRHMYQEIKESGYNENNIVYTNHLNMTKIGGTAHLIPKNPYKGTGPTATHIALIDGHTNFYMLGFDCSESGKDNNVYVDTPCYNDKDTEVNVAVWGKQIYDIIKANDQATFTFVEGSQPQYYRDLSNYGTMTYAELNTHINQHGQKNN